MSEMRDIEREAIKERKTGRSEQESAQRKNEVGIAGGGNCEREWNKK